jgi:hypothetical protein
MESTDALSYLHEAIAQQLGKAVEDSNLRIQQGQRIVYGRLASGEQRNELSDEQINAIASLIKQPQTEGIKATDYKGKVPSFQVQVDQQTVFRQERDGAISLKSLLSENNLEPEAPDPWETAITTEAEPEPELPATTVETPTIVEALKSMLNPLDQPTTEPITANLGGYDITQDDNQLAIAQAGVVLLTADDEHVQTENAQQELLQPLKKFATVHAIVQGLVDGFDWVQQTSNTTDQQTDQPVPIPTAKPVTALPQDIQPNTTETIKTLFDRLPTGSNQDFWRRVAGDLEQAVKFAQSIDPASIRKNAVNTAQQVASTVRQFVESEDFQQTQRTVTTKVQDGLIWSAEKAGQGLEAAGQWAQKAGQWLAARPEVIREQRAAAIALSMFQKGFERTQEHSYEKQGLTVAFQGRNTFTLSNAGGEMLLKFKAEQSLSGEPKITIIEKGAFGRSHSQVLEEIRQDKGIVRGSTQAEEQHAQKSQQIGTLAKHLAEAIGTNIHEGKLYYIHIEPDSIKIFARDGRGEIFRQQGEEVFSRFNKQDFARFQQATQQEKLHLAKQFELE